MSASVIFPVLITSVRTHGSSTLQRLTTSIAHIGGFLMGLLCAMIFYPIISLTKRHKAIVWFCRLAAIALAIVLYYVLIHNFYTGDPYAGELPCKILFFCPANGTSTACSWCRYLSCIPTAANNQCQGSVPMSLASIVYFDTPLQYGHINAILNPHSFCFLNFVHLCFFRFHGQCIFIWTLLALYLLIPNYRNFTMISPLLRDDSNPQAIRIQKR